MKRWIGWLGVALFAFSIPLAAVGKTTDQERKIGKEASEELEKDKTVKWVTDQAILDRVNKIGQGVAQFADEPDLTYDFHVIDTPDVNAFSLPGGHIYINKGLIDRVDSDDELAGVIAHEIGHAAQHHYRQLAAKQKKMDWATLAVLLAGAVSHSDVSTAALLSQVVTTARVNGYGMKFETDADMHAVKYLSDPKCPYNPVGVLTFMERLERDEALRGGSQVDLGIYQTHPLSKQRVEDLIAELKRRGVAIDRRKVMNSLQVFAKNGKIGDQTAGEIWVGKIQVATVAGDDTGTALERAQAVAARLDTAMGRKLGVQDVRLGSDGTSVWAGKTMLVSAGPADARLLGQPESEIAKQVQKNLQAMLWKQFYNTIY